MIVASFTPVDQNAVSAFWTKIYQEMYWKILPSDGFDNVADFFHLPEGFLLVIKEDKVIVGCGGVKPLTKTVGIVKRFYLAQNLRGKGVAKELLDKIIEVSKSKGLRELVLDVYYKNIRAARFYEKHGFQKYIQEPILEWPQSQSPAKFYYYKLSI